MRQCFPPGTKAVHLPHLSISRLSVRFINRYRTDQKASVHGHGMSQRSSVTSRERQGLVNYRQSPSLELRGQKSGRTWIYLIARGEREAQDHRTRRIDGDEGTRTQPPGGDDCDRWREKYLGKEICVQPVGASTRLQTEQGEGSLNNHKAVAGYETDQERTNIGQHASERRDQGPVHIKQLRISNNHRSVLVEHLNNWLRVGIDLQPAIRSSWTTVRVLKLEGNFHTLVDLQEIPNTGERGTGCSGNGTLMGLAGSPAIFRRIIESVTQRWKVTIYQDDIIVHKLY